MFPDKKQLGEGKELWTKDTKFTASQASRENWYKTFYWWYITPKDIEKMDKDHYMIALDKCKYVVQPGGGGFRLSPLHFIFCTPTIFLIYAPIYFLKRKRNREYPTGWLADPHLAVWIFGGGAQFDLKWLPKEGRQAVCQEPLSKPAAKGETECKIPAFQFWHFISSTN